MFQWVGTVVWFCFVYKLLYYCSTGFCVLATGCTDIVNFSSANLQKHVILGKSLTFLPVTFSSFTVFCTVTVQ